MKKVLFPLLVATLVLGAAGNLFAADAKIVLKLAEIHPKGYPTELADEEFAKLVNKYTNGEIRIDVYPGGELSGDEKVIIEQVKVGVVHFARVSSGALGAFNPQMNVFGLPYLFDSKEHMWAFLNGTYGQKMLTDLIPSGFFGLTWYDGGARSFYSKNPIATPADLKGQKFRMIGNPILLKMADALGASSVSMAAGQVFGAIQTGVLDGAENNAPSLISFNHYQVVKYYTLDEHARLPEVLFMNRMVWDKMSLAQQTAINRAADETVQFQRKAWDAYEVEALKKVKDAGVIVTPVPDKGAWQAAVKSVFDAESGPYAETVKAVDAARQSLKKK